MWKLHIFLKNEKYFLLLVKFCVKICRFDTLDKTCYWLWLIIVPYNFVRYEILKEEMKEDSVTLIRGLYNPSSLNIWPMTYEKPD